ncbi:hypothetical protein Bequi_09900 [Brachybacterium sp. JHP9]|uniref:PqqD family protein n=1 Tax=Brachybacterium equifaecis TaxID=2910770 RepID=A0ABT0R1C7_9MICO|nr:hypothetical protein [Brachybacterium equifaecis]MCL6423696.1 hypothetical protein [Brachybacterium equifaecis]
MKDLAAPRTIPHLAKADLGVHWFLPGARRHFATSTRATSDLIVLLAVPGRTVRQAREEVRFDADAASILEFMVEHGLGERELAGLVSQ